jgi:hypothetical protein
VSVLCNCGRNSYVLDVAREAGIRYPVALTAAVWERCVRVSEGVACQDEAGRLWDVVWMLRCALGRASGCEVAFGVHVRNDNRERTPPLVRLKAVQAGGRQGTGRHGPDAGRGLSGKDARPANALRVGVRA